MGKVAVLAAPYAISTTMPEELSSLNLRFVIYKMALVEFESNCAGR